MMNPARSPLIAVHVVIAAAAALSLSAQEASVPFLSDRLVYVSRTLTSDEHVADIDRITATAAAKGLNGMVLAAGLERVGAWPRDRLARLQRVQALCSERRLDIIRESDYL